MNDEFMRHALHVLDASVFNLPRLAILPDEITSPIDHNCRRWCHIVIIIIVVVITIIIISSSAIIIVVDVVVIIIIIIIIIVVVIIIIVIIIIIVVVTVTLELNMTITESADYYLLTLFLSDSQGSVSP